MPSASNPPKSFIGVRDIPELLQAMIAEQQKTNGYLANLQQMISITSPAGHNAWYVVNYDPDVGTGITLNPDQGTDNLLLPVKGKYGYLLTLGIGALTSQIELDLVVGHNADVSNTIRLKGLIQDIYESFMKENGSGIPYSIDFNQTTGEYAINVNFNPPGLQFGGTNLSLRIYNRSSSKQVVLVQGFLLYAP